MRIASLQPSISLTLAALGRLDALCAVTKYCLDAVPELAGRGLPVLQDSWSAHTDQILAARPDLVAASVPYRMESLAAILKTGLPVLALAPHTLADIYNDIHLIAAIVHAVREGEELVARMQETVAQVRAQSASALQVRVYAEEWGKPLIRSQHWIAELVEAAGGRFLGEPGTQTTADEVAAADPDVLLFSWCGAGNRVPLARVIEQRGWHHLPAVQSRRVFCIPDEYFNSPAPTLLSGLFCVAAALHPEIFPKQPQLIQLEA